MNDIKFKVTNSNSKLGSICAINLPAIKTCREDAPCKKLCYANKGNFVYKNVKKCYEDNLNAFLKDKEQTKKDIIEQLPIIGFCRIHASGDFVNMEYLEMLVEIAKEVKGVNFMAFTKKYELVNEFIANGNKIPSNFKILFSGWHGLEMNNPYNLPTAFVRLNNVVDNRIKKTAIECSGKCDKCFACWNVKKKQQVVFHQH